MIFTGQAYFARPLSICADARDRRAKSLILSGSHIVVYFVRHGIVRD